MLAKAHSEHGGELTRISVETAVPVGSFTGWTPARSVTQWAVAVASVSADERSDQISSRYLRSMPADDLGALSDELLSPARTDRNGEVSWPVLDIPT